MIQQPLVAHLTSLTANTRDHSGFGLFYKAYDLRDVFEPICNSCGTSASEYPSSIEVEYESKFIMALELEKPETQEQVVVQRKSIVETTD